MKGQPWLNHDHEKMARWNAQFPIGTMVIVTRDNGKQYRSRTKSEAFKIHPHSPVLIHLTHLSFVNLEAVIAIEKPGPQGQSALPARSGATGTSGVRKQHVR
jgi:hypothetical protein